MDLERDLFTVTVAADRPSEAELVEAVKTLGYGAAVELPEESKDAPADEQLESGPLPDLLVEALDEARRDRKLVLVDFHAKWCAPCKRMLDETFKDPRIAAELEGFVLLKVDTDELPQISRRFRVATIPDARILAPDGAEIERVVGFKTVDEMLAILRRARQEARGH